MNVAEWLRSLGLERYEPAFRENDVGADLLHQLTAEDLKELGVATVGHRRRLLAAIGALQQGDAEVKAVRLAMTARAIGQHRPPSGGISRSCSATSWARPRFRLGLIRKNFVKC